MFAARLIAALLLLLLGLVAVFRVPHGLLWKPAVGATTFGIWLIPLAALVTWTASERDIASLLAVCGAVLIATPLIRALPAASAVEAEVVRVFGDRPWSPPGAPPPRTDAYTLVGLLGPGSAGPEPVRHRFDAAHELDLELYPGAGPGPHPVVVAIHGGSWNSGEPNQLSAVYRYLAARGITVAATTYRFAPTHVFPAQVEDVERTLEWLGERAEELDIDPARTVLMGRSAGGHLALLTGYRSSAPGIRGVVALYPPTDMNWSWDNPTNPLVLDSPKTLSEFLGGPRDAIPEVFDAASPIRFVSPTSPPTLLIHGTRDELVFAEQSRRLARELEAEGVAHVLVETPWDTHGLDANLGGPGGQLYLWSLERFLGRVFAAEP